MPFELWTRVGPRKHAHALAGVQIPRRRGNFLGKDMPGHVRRHCRELCKMAERIEMPFGLWTRVGSSKHALGGVHTSATWRIPLNRPSAWGCGFFVKLLWPLVTIIKTWCEYFRLVHLSSVTDPKFWKDSRVWGQSPPPKKLNIFAYLTANVSSNFARIAVSALEIFLTVRHSNNIRL